MSKELVTKLKEQTAVTKPISIEDMIRQSAKELGKALPSHMRPERIIQIYLSSLRLTPKLYKCDPMSFIAALFQSAQLGLEPNVGGQAYIIPYWSTKFDRFMAQFQIGYPGYMEMFYRHQNSMSLQMETVHKNDFCEYDLGKNEMSHKPPLFGQDRGPVTGFYMVAQLKDGGRIVKVLSKEDAMAHGRRYSKCFDHKTQKFDPSTPWATEPDAMCMKTVLLKGMKLVPKSIEIQKAIGMDGTVKTKVSLDMAEIPSLEAPWEPQDGSAKPPQNGNEGDKSGQPEAKWYEETITIRDIRFKVSKNKGKDYMEIETDKGTFTKWGPAGSDSEKRLAEAKIRGEKVRVKVKEQGRFKNIETIIEIIKEEVK